jgi:hypothetical protein
VAASVDAIDGIPAEEVERVTSELERAIKARYPEVRRLFIETRSVAGHAAAVQAAKVPGAAAMTAPPSRKAKKRAKKQKA